MKIISEKIYHPVHGEILILSIDGEVDMHTSPALRTEFKNAQTSSAKFILVQFENVKFIDSSGIATLVEALKGKQKLILCEMTPAVRDVFSLARLDQVFKIINTKNELLAT